MIEELRPGQVVEFEHALGVALGGTYRLDGLLKRLRVIDIDERNGVVLMRDEDQPFSAIPLDVVKKRMIVLQEPSPPAMSPVVQMTKDDVFDAVLEFINHHDKCVECEGEIEGGELSERYRYLCDEAKRILAWFVQRP